MPFDNIVLKTDCSCANFQEVADLLKRAGISYHPAEMHRKAFAASYATVFLYNAEQLVGVGRAISDGMYQAALYDFAVAPSYQKQGLGKRILEAILEKVGHCNIILYAAPGKEGFYQRYGFRRMKTGMALFLAPDQKRGQGFTE